MGSILIVNDKASGGGAETVMRDIVKYLHQKYEITVMTFDDDYVSFRRVFPENVRYIPAKIKRNPYRRINPLHYVVSIYNRLRRAYLRSGKYDIVIANKEGPCMQFVSKMRAEKKLAWVHVDYGYLYWTQGTFGAAEEVNCMQRFDNIVCVSNAAAESVKKVIGNPGNLCVRYNPIDYSSIEANSEEKVEIHRDETKPLFVAVGRIVPQKNFLTLARICSRLCKEYDFEVWIVGDGEQRVELEEILKQESCNCVKILGMQSNPHKYLVKADFLIINSLFESYGLVIQEALVLGVPVLATRCPAIEECFDTRFGMLVDCDEVAIEQGLRYILEHPECAAEYKNVIKKEYDKTSLWEQRLQKIEDLLR